jgi:hypothetical protein|tara:strand:+ start:623 stop:1753 length:1131 start_codon:yes stop_codon:yes gene_type:complete
MNRTLKRPMFRMGGSTNSGITSGLDTPKRGLVDGPGKYSQSVDMAKVLADTRAQITPENLAAYKPYLERPKGEALNRFLMDFGLNLMSTPPSGSGFTGLLSTGARAAKEPTAQLFKDIDDRRLTKQAAEADLFKTLLQGNLDVAAEAAGNEGGAKTYSQLEISKKIKEEVSNIARLKKDLSALPEEGTPNFNQDAKDALMLELRQSSESLDFLRKNNPNAEALLKNDTIVDGLVASIMQELSKDREKYPKGMQDKQLYIDAIAEFQTIIQGAKTSFAEGGRAGYRVGGGVMGGGEDMGANRVTETATTPEPTKIQEMPISYDQLRARLPKEIGDDIVRLISASPEALEDFATISTQSDVDLFNQKYSVNLVLPQEA